jgi:hypothetical protein
MNEARMNENGPNRIVDCSDPLRFELWTKHGALPAQSARRLLCLEVARIHIVETMAE